MEGQKGPAIARVQEKIPFFRNKLPELISLADRRNLITPSLETSQTENPSKVSAGSSEAQSKSHFIKNFSTFNEGDQFYFYFFSIQESLLGRRITDREQVVPKSLEGMTTAHGANMNMQMGSFLSLLAVNAKQLSVKCFGESFRYNCVSVLPRAPQ